MVEHRLVAPTAGVRFPVGPPCGVGIGAVPLASNQERRVRISHPAPDLVASLQGEGARLLTANEVGSIPTPPAKEG